jgi:hypothetical protein
MSFHRSIQSFRRHAVQSREFRIQHHLLSTYQMDAVLNDLDRHRFRRRRSGFPPSIHFSDMENGSKGVEPENAGFPGDEAMMGSRGLVQIARYARPDSSGRSVAE